MGTITTKTLFQINNCWLSPKGAVIVRDDEFDGHAFHEDLGYCIIRDLENFKDKDAACLHIQTYRGGSAVECLEDAGFVRLHGFQVDAKQAKWVIPEGTKLTFHQKLKIKNWCKLNGRNWDDAVLYC